MPGACARRRAATGRRPPPSPVTATDCDLTAAQQADARQARPAGVARAGALSIDPAGVIAPLRRAAAPRRPVRRAPGTARCRSDRRHVTVDRLCWMARPPLGEQL